MKLNQFIQEYKPILTDTINGYIRDRIKENSEVSFYEDTLSRLFTFSTSGKMLRGIFILLIYSYFKPLSSDSKVMYAGAAMELIQSALLIHDDIIDNDDIRRGTNTIFAQYKEQALINNITDSENYGRNMGICAGDIAIFTAFELLTRASSDGQITNRLVALFARENHLVVSGEMLDVDMAASLTEQPVLKVLDMYRLKTARYTFALPFTAGAILGDADEKTTRMLADLGEYIGILFQIHDDWLGLYGKEEQTGKPVGSDIREKKKTLYRSLLYEALPESEKSKIATQSIEEMHTFMKQYSIEDKVAVYKQEYERKAKSLIQELPFSQDQKDVLLEVVELVSRRIK